MSQFHLFSNDLPLLKINYSTSGVKKAKIVSSETAYNVLKQIYDPDTVEYDEKFYCLYLNNAGETISHDLIGIGGMTATYVDQKKVFRGALLSGATSIILSHNHPSGTLRPSRQDINLTNQIIEGAKLLGLKVHDHIIFTKYGYYSFIDEGDIPY